MVNMCETWIDEKKDGRVCWRDCRTHMNEWVCSYAIRKGGRGKAKEGVLISKKVERDKRGRKLNIRKKNEKMVWCNMEIGKESLDMIMVYGGQGRGKLGDGIEEFIGREDLGSIMIGGDFNIRMRELRNGGVEEEIVERCSKDKVIGNGGTQLAEWIMEKGWMILNGRTEGDWEGKYTYVEVRGSSVIDYVIVNEAIGDKI